ncbi:MAG TPA: hypothetical protein VH370_23150 [Humisphaera sp.]|nr:hypothetical protein [Humisphaera sp.]
MTTPLADYIAAFARRLAQRDLEEGAIDLYISLMHPKTRYRWKKVEARRKRDEGFKLIDLAEPVVQVRPFYASLSDDGRLWFSFSYDVHHSSWLGLELSFPRIMSLCEEGHARLHETSEYRNAQLYQDLRRAIQEITSPARFTTPAGEKRTRVRISSEAASQLAAHPGLKRRGLEIRLP